VYLFVNKQEESKMKTQIDGVTILELSDTDIACLRNDLLSIEEWIKEAIVGKVNNCKKRMIQEWQPKLFADPHIESVPANEDDFVSLVVSRDDYKTRVEREEELEA